MKQQIVTKVLIIISIITIILGLIISLSISVELENSIPDNEIMIDGSNCSGIVQITGFLGSKIIGTIVVFISIFIDIAIWCIYGIVLGILKIIKKTRK